MLDKINEKILKLKIFQNDKLKNIYLKIMNKEFISYIFFGVCTTLINVLLFSLFTYYIYISIPNENLNIALSNISAFIFAVLFAFIINKNVVFRSKTSSKKELTKQVFKFYFLRIVSFVIDTIGMLLLTNLLLMNKVVAKVICNIIVIILNYFFSKKFIFKKPQE